MCLFGFITILQQKLAKKEAGGIDRTQDIARLREFYKLYREKNNVDQLREEEMKLRQSGVFSGNLGEYVLELGPVFLLRDDYVMLCRIR